MLANAIGFGGVSMRDGIFICGLNGSGKSTLGSSLADAMNYKYIDIEECYFPDKNINDAYYNACSSKEAESNLLDKLDNCGDFVLSSVMGDKFCDEIVSLFTWVILLNVPKEIRLQRVKERSYKQFGERILPGGDLYESEKHFFETVNYKAEDIVEDWVNTIDINIIRLDGTKPIKESVDCILEVMGASIDSFA